MKIKGLLDQVSLRQFGVPEKFEHLFNEVYQGEDGGIYAAYGKTMHLLAKNSKAYPIVLGRTELPKDVAEMRKKIYASSPAGDKIRSIFGVLHPKRKRFAFVAESNYSSDINKVFIKSKNTYKELPEQNFCGIDSYKVLIVGGVLMVAKEQTFIIIDFVPIFESSSSMIFWGGDRDLFEACFEDGELYIRYFGRFKKFTQTTVSNLLETEIDKQYCLDYLGQYIQNLGMSDFKDSFEIDETTGTVVCNSEVCCGDIQDSTYIYKDGKYEKQD